MGFLDFLFGSSKRIVPEGSINEQEQNKKDGKRERFSYFGKSPYVDVKTFSDKAKEMGSNISGIRSDKIKTKDQRKEFAQEIFGKDKHLTKEQIKRMLEQLKKELRLKKQYGRAGYEEIRALQEKIRFYEELTK